MRPKKIVIQYEREIRPHPSLSNGAYFMLQMAEEQETGRFYYLISSLMLSAFTIESYLNYIGEKHIASWKEIEKESTIEKIKKIGAISSIDMDWGQRPYQTITSLFRFRNDLAHAKPKILQGKKIIREDSFEDYDVKDFWEDYPTIEHVRNAKSDILKVMEAMGRALGDNSGILENGMTSISEL